MFPLRQVTDVVLTRAVVLSCSQDATVRLWRVESPEPVRVIHNNLHIQVRREQTLSTVYLTFLLPQNISVTERLLVVKDRSNSILLLSFPDCLRPDLPPVLHTNSPHLPGLVFRHLQTYASGGEILDIKAEMTGMAELSLSVFVFIVLLRSGVRS